MSFTPRPATAADYDHFARLLPELGTGDPTPPRERWEQVYAPGAIFLEDEGGAVVAYGYSEVLRGVGYVRHVVVDPARRGAGVGRAVMDALAARLRAAGCSRWALNVKPENEPAVRLYRRVGMTEAYAATALRLEWSVADRLPRGGRAVIARPIEAGEEGPLEAAFDMPEGQLAALRARPGMLLVRLVDPAAPEDARVGVACFDPKFPGAFPFRVAALELAAPLLDALRPHALPEPPYTQLVVEDDAALTAALVQSGATVRFVIAHMRGEIPPAP
ncbi:MAG: GNAT family N-acetyltransferase [Polyangiaceae bacterium]|nr:GNAT family N-acetyltransferase [Polyangiaceae bacterium]